MFMKFILSYKNFVILLFIIFVLLECSSQKDVIKLTFNKSAAKINEKLSFKWTGLSKKVLNPLITFWDYENEPSIDKRFVQGSWKFLNSSSSKGSSTADVSGKIVIKAPNKEGIYKVFICYELNEKFQCKFFRNLAIITCRLENFNISKYKEIMKKIKLKTQIKRKDFLYNKKEASSEQTFNTNCKYSYQVRGIDDQSEREISVSQKQTKYNKSNSVNLRDFQLAFEQNEKIALSQQINYKTLKNKNISYIDYINKNKISKSNIEHIIILISENHSFDSIYGRYCKAPTFSKPKCNFGPECCEAAPTKLNGVSPFELTDKQNSLWDPCHDLVCMLTHINGGKMNKFLVNSEGADPRNFAVASDSEESAKNYFNFAREGAMADNFFSSTPGASCQNNMYFASGKFLFFNNEYRPQKASFKGNSCEKTKYKVLIRFQHL